MLKQRNFRGRAYTERNLRDAVEFDMVDNLNRQMLSSHGILHGAKLAGRFRNAKPWLKGLIGNDRY